MSIGGKREAWLVTACGRKGSGKSYETTKEIEDYVRTLNRKFLILDLNNEFGQYRPILCDERNIKLFVAQKSVEVRRIAPFKKGGIKTLDELKNDMDVLLAHYRDGGLLIEDPALILGDSLDKEFVGAVCTLRHKSVDIILHFQSLSKTGHPKLVANTNILRYHRVEDTVERSKDKFVGKIEILKIAEAISRNKVEFGLDLQRDYEKKNPDYRINPKKQKEYEDIYNKYCRVFIWINYDNQRLSGRFNAQDMRDGIFRYMSENRSTTINFEKEKIDRTGTKIYKTRAKL
ncbi:MAG: hypothetical protein HC892_09955 [Saprospiraceae bacterium]|nr:hypothetical protein [Saprospiraceae bacterium]